MNTKIKKITLALIITLISIFILKILFFSSFIDLIKLKNDLNNLDGKNSIEQVYGNIYNIYSMDNKKRIQISLPDKFKKLENFDYNDDFFNYNVAISLDGKESIGAITIGQDSNLVSKINSSTSKDSIIEYNNKIYRLSLQTVWQSIIMDEVAFAIVTPIDSQYYYTIMISVDSYKLNEEDLEALLNFKVIK